MLEESAAIKRTQGNWVGLAITLNNLGMLAGDAGDVDGAIAYLEETSPSIATSAIRTGSRILWEIWRG